MVLMTVNLVDEHTDFIQNTKDLLWCFSFIQM